MEKGNTKREILDASLELFSVQGFEATSTSRLRSLTMKTEELAGLTAQNDTAACALAERILTESRETDAWYEYFDFFASLLRHPKSLVWNRALHILAANARWDNEGHFGKLLPEYLTHITDEKPITARQCVQALAEVGTEKPELIPRILEALDHAELSKYADSMRPLIEKDIARTRKLLAGFQGG